MFARCPLSGPKRTLAKTRKCLLMKEDRPSRGPFPNSRFDLKNSTAETGSYFWHAGHAVQPEGGCAISDSWEVKSCNLQAYNIPHFYFAFRFQKNHCHLVVEKVCDYVGRSRNIEQPTVKRFFGRQLWCESKVLGYLCPPESKKFGKPSGCARRNKFRSVFESGLLSFHRDQCWPDHKPRARFYLK
jgi:hypothetical protein